ncbi:MAG: gliding motility-associated C-terminal domain-containing protein, partial [Bacteroidetes bacterium]|nr:gliding motility-associated C-terminal domain-containing protein [Bacteroidota bacterium]
AQVICENENLGTLTYLISGGTTNVTLTGAPAGISGVLSGSTFTISGNSANVALHNYTVTASGGTCPDADLAGTIDIKPEPQITLSSAPATANQTVCLNSPIVGISYSISGSATGASSLGLPTGVSGSFAAGVYSISGSPTVSGTFNYKVFTSGGPCIGDSAYGVITVQSPPQITLSSAPATAAQTVCENQTITNIVYNITGSFTTASVSGLPAGVIGTLSGTQFTISGQPSVSGTFNYTITVNSANCGAVNIGGTITVQAGVSLLLTAGPQSQTVCLGNPITQFNYTYGGAGTAIIASGLPAGVTTNLVGKTLQITGTPSAIGTSNYTVSASGGTCPQADSVGTITVVNNTIKLISPAYTNDQTVCVGLRIDTIRYEVSGTVTVNDLPPGVNFTVVGTNPTVVTIFGTPTTPGAFYYTLNVNNFCGNSTVVGNIDVAPALSSNTSGSNLTVCESTNFTLTGSVLPSSAVSYTYLWQVGNTVTGAFAAAPPLNNQPNYTGSLALGSTARFFRRIVFAGACSDTGNVVTVTIDAKPRIQATGSATICSEDTLQVPNMVVTNGNVGNWTSNGFGQLQFANTPNPRYIPSKQDAGNNVTLSFLVSSNNTCAPISVSGTYLVKVKADPVAETSGQVEVCAFNAKVNLSGLVINGTANWSSDGLGTIDNPNAQFATYNTSPFDAGDTVKVYLTSTSIGCVNELIDSALFTIIVKADGADPSIQVDAGVDTTLYLGQAYQMKGDGNLVQYWFWTPSLGLSDSTDNDPIATPDITTTYILTGVNVSGCIDRDTMTITISDTPVLNIPNLFSPNGDGYNDLFVIPEISKYPNTPLTIINREGVIVYETDNYKNEWDGNFKGNKLPEATYYYLLEFKNVDKVIKGPITILRNGDN